MKKILAFAALSLAATLQVVYAQESPASRHAAGLAFEHRGDYRSAYIAFLAAAEAGHPPAQKKLGEIYDSGTPAVKRDFSSSIHWYEKAREGGEVIPSPPSPMPSFIKTP